jgi:hypothetical protein
VARLSIEERADREDGLKLYDAHACRHRSRRSGLSRRLTVGAPARRPALFTRLPSDSNIISQRLVTVDGPHGTHRRPVDERPVLVDDRLVWQPSVMAEAFRLDVRGFVASVKDAGPLP